MGDIIAIYFRGKRLSTIRNLVIESLGNPNWTSLCLIIYNELIRNATVFVLVSYFLNDCPNFPKIVFVVYKALISFFPRVSDRYQLIFVLFVLVDVKHCWMF